MAKINRVEICFNSKLPRSFPEQKAVEELILYFNLPKSFTKDVDISTSYGKVPGVTESLNMGDCSEELYTFMLARAMILGMSQKKIGKIIPRPFTCAGTKGVLIAGYVK